MVVERCSEVSVVTGMDVARSRKLYDWNCLVHDDIFDVFLEIKR